MQKKNYVYRTYSSNLHVSRIGCLQKRTSYTTYRDPALTFVVAPADSAQLPESAEPVAVGQCLVWPSHKCVNRCYQFLATLFAEKWD